MSGFSNPFSQFSDVSNNESGDEIVSTSYLTNLPDPRLILDDQVSIIFKQLLKRDVRTRVRALGEFESWIDNLQPGALVDEQIHLAYIQLYAKLSLDNLPEMRARSHTVLGKLYKLLGKQSSKYLKYSVGPWFIARYDPDVQVVTAATSSMTAVFAADKQKILFDKFRDRFEDYIYHACATASSQSLSDVRYNSEESMTQKYTRLVKCCLDALSADPKLFDLTSPQILELVETGRFWKFFSSGDSMLARSSFRLAQAYLKELSPWVGSMWKELLRAARKKLGGSGVAQETLMMMNVLTKHHADDVWPEGDVKARGDALASLAQFIHAEPPHGVRFWPLFYNLIMMIPQIQPAEMSVLYKPLERVVLGVKYNVELEESAWGCYVSLASKMGDKFPGRTFLAAERRTTGPNPPVQAMAKFLARIYDAPGVEATVISQLKNTTEVPFDYISVLAYTHKFRSALEDTIIPEYLIAGKSHALSALIDADQELNLGTMSSIDAHLKAQTELDSLSWIKISVKSNKVDSQQLLASLHLTEKDVPVLLNHAHELSKKGVSLNLDSFYETHPIDADLEVAAITAQGSGFLSESFGSNALRSLITQAMQDRHALGSLTRAIRANSRFVEDQISTDKTLIKDLNMLSRGDHRGIISSLSGLKIEEGGASAKPELDANVAVESINLEELDLSTASEASLNPLRALAPVGTRQIDEVVTFCELLAEKALALHTSLSQSHVNAKRSDESATTLAIIESFVSGWLQSLPATIRLEMPFSCELKDNLTLKAISPSDHLLLLLDSQNAALAFHAALAAAKYGVGRSQPQFSREDFSGSGTLKGALVAYYSSVKNNVQYDQIQRNLVREAQAGKLPASSLKLVDQSFIPETAVFPLGGDDEELSQALIIQTFGWHVEEIDSLATTTSSPVLLQVASTLALSQDSGIQTVLEAAACLPENGSLLVKSGAVHCLKLLNAHFAQGDVNDEQLDEITETAYFQNLLNRSDLIEIPWMCTVFPETPQDLSLYLDLSNEEATASALVSWVIFLQLSPESRSEVPTSSWSALFAWIIHNVDLSADASMGAYLSTDPPSQPPSFADLALYLLFNVSKQYSNTVREWYRDTRDKTLVKKIDRLFINVVTPGIISSLKSMFELQKDSISDSDEVTLTINEKLREIRALREVEDEFTVEIIVSLPEKFPCKPASVAIKNLAGVNEAKKRGWLLEARQHIQDGGVFTALRAVLTRLNNFLEGVEPCAICYLTVNDQNKLPNKSCGNCHNIYHPECIYKWFTSNSNNRLCPMCRTPM